MSRQKPQPHDHLFKLLLDEPGLAAALLRERLPPRLVASLTDAAPQLVPGTFVGENLGEARSDRLFRATKRSGDALYCLVEHKSALDPRIGLQLHDYLRRIWRRLDREQGHQGKLPIVFPLVVYHGGARWKGPRRFNDLLAGDARALRCALDFPFEVFDVGRADPRTLSAEPRLRGGLLLLHYALRFPRERPAETLASMLSDLAGMSETFLAAAGTYMLQLYPLKREQMLELVRAALPGKEEVLVSEAYERTLAEGREQGEKEGFKKGAHHIVRQLLERRFGPLPAPALARLQATSEPELELLAQRVLDARSLEEALSGRS